MHSHENTRRSLERGSSTMPGISFYCNFSDISESKRTMILGHGYECGEQGSVSKILINDKRCVLTCESYAGYPFVSFETDQFRVFLEGRIYSEDERTLDRALITIGENLMRGSDNAAYESIRSWLLDTDGEFVLLIQHKQAGVVHIVTDALGRLPLYYSRDEQSIMVSRQMDLVAAVQDRKEYDRLAIAQYLLFAYSLGNRTLLQGVHCIEPCSVIRVDPRSSRIELQRLHTFSFSEKLHSGKSLETNATELSKLMSVACRSRTSSKRCNIVSLSGGLDSRAIAACMKNASISVSAATMIDADGAYRADVDIAEQIARVLGIDWKLFKLPIPRGRDAYRLLSMKAGLNSLSMSFILQFFDMLRSTYGSEINYITGDGGDKVLIDLRPKASLRSLSDLVQYIVSRHQLFSLEDVSRMTGVLERDIIRSISEQVDSYPEQDFDNKLVHFVIFERGRKWLFEGEDRNRNFFWHLAPFYGIQFFRYAMNCPDEQKADHTLYKELLVKLSPEVAAINNMHWGFPITSRMYHWFVFKRFLLGLVSTGFKKRLRRQMPQNEVPRERYKECVSKQMASCDAINEYLECVELMRQLELCTKREAQILLTVTSTLELITSGRSSIKDYWNEQF
jgi:asparagine synthase (glutamine-hydrolysing)